VNDKPCDDRPLKKSLQVSGLLLEIGNLETKHSNEGKPESERAKTRASPLFSRLKRVERRGNSASSEQIPISLSDSIAI
jgi:hypothetical protein